MALNFNGTPVELGNGTSTWFSNPGSSTLPASTDTLGVTQPQGENGIVFSLPSWLSTLGNFNLGDFLSLINDNALAAANANNTPAYNLTLLNQASADNAAGLELLSTQLGYQQQLNLGQEAIVSGLGQSAAQTFVANNASNNQANVATTQSNNNFWTSAISSVTGFLAGLF